jgi:uroporphyrinogen decarboxylase
MQAEPETWGRLLDLIATATSAYVHAQARAGADVIALFDTWASVLTPEEYVASVAPFTHRMVDGLAIPVIHHVARSASLLDALAFDRCAVLSVDSRQSLAAARRRLGQRRAVQGNLDASTILAGWRFAASGARDVLAEGAGVGHIFSLGEPSPREADPGILRALVSLVHDESARRANPGAIVSA